MQVTIDVDLGKHADEWEPVAFRKPLPGEWFITDCGHPHTWGVQEHYNPRIIIRRKWKWPEWLKAKWIAKTKEGPWFATNACPRVLGECWETYESHGHLSEKFYDFVGPPCEDWKQSLMINPNYSE